MRFLLNGDWDLQTWLQAHRTDAMDQVMRIVTWFGDRWVLTPVAVIAVLLLAVRRHRREALAVAIAGLMSLIVVETIKPLIRRERPLVAAPFVPVPESFSFPSGHATSSAAIYGVLALLLAQRLTHAWGRVAVISGTVLLVSGVGLSRMYLGVHYGSDVLAGWACGWALALLTSRLICPAEDSDRRKSGDVTP